MFGYPVGSMADIPKDLLQEIKKLEELFTVDTAKLKQITDHFVSELAKGSYTPRMLQGSNSHHLSRPERRRR